MPIPLIYGNIIPHDGDTDKMLVTKLIETIINNNGGGIVPVGMDTPKDSDDLRLLYTKLLIVIRAYGF